MTGELLKSERNNLKLSVQDVAFALKLSPRVLLAIEEGDLDSLPAKTFVRGFVKSYAQFLKLDTDLVMRQFQEEMGATAPTPKYVTAPPNDSSKIKEKKLADEQTATKTTPISTVTPNLKTDLNKKNLLLIVFISVGVVAIAFINYMVNKYQKEGLTPSTQTIEKISVEQLNQEIKSEKIVSTSSADASMALKVSADSSPAVSTNTHATDSKSVELVIEAIKDTSISYALAGESDFKTIDLKKDSFQIIRSKNGLTLKTPVGNSIQITVNGLNKGPASHEEKPVQLTY